MFLLVVRRTLERGWRSGLIAGAAIATADAVYATLAAFGVAALINLLIGLRRWIEVAGGVGIASIGIKGLLAPTLPSSGGGGKDNETSKRGVKDNEILSRKGRQKESGAYLSTLLLTLSNPPTILAFIALFSGLGLRVQSGWLQASLLVAGVMLGSAAWWLVLTAVVALVRQRISPGATRALAVISGLVLIVAGALIALQAL
jgi:threonine/homoserine/homoserine lactone efflux protein